MSLLKSNSIQIGQSATATNNFTLAVPSSPDGTIKLARGNSGATTADIISVSSAGAITGATINGGAITSATAQATTSGTAIDFTGIPSWVKRITVMFNGVSTSGVSQAILQIGDSGGIETTGYLGATSQNGATVFSHATNNGIVIDGGTNAASIRHGIIVLSLVVTSTNTWANSGTIGRSDDLICSYVGGTKPLSGTLTQLRVTTFNGTDTFDAGSINIMYEG